VSEFYPIKSTRTAKTQVLLRFDTYDYDRVADLHPHNVTVQEKLRQIIKMFLDEGMDEPVNAPIPADVLDGL